MFVFSVPALGVSNCYRAGASQELGREGWPLSDAAQYSDDLAEDGGVFNVGALAAAGR
jgi:hypothetical protein